MMKETISTETGTVTGVADMQSRAQPREWEYTAGAADNTQAWVDGRVGVCHLIAMLQIHTHKYTH